MTEVEVDISFGMVRVFNVLDTTVSELIVAGKAFLCGWSLRTTSVQSSQDVESSVAAPGAGATIATLALPQGEWSISWQVSVSGTVAAAEINNLQLEQNAVTLMKSVNGNTVGQPYSQSPVTVSIPLGGQNVTVNAVAAGTAGSTYTAQIVASPIGATAVAEITSNGYPVGEISLPVGGANSQSLSHDGVMVANDITISILSGSFRGAVYWRDGY
jgi:hypothetical protein